MDQWSKNVQFIIYCIKCGGFLNDTGTPIHTSKSGPKRPFPTPVTVGQVLEASEEGLKVGTRSTTMDSVQSKRSLNLMENSYYHVYGYIKSTQGHLRVMVFKTVPVTDFNEVTAFMLEVINVNNYLEKEANKIPEHPPLGFTSYKRSLGSFETSTNNYNQNSFTPVQEEVLDAIKNVGAVVGWSKHDPTIKKKFSSKQIQDALDFLVGERHIYTTVEDDHFCLTGSIYEPNE